MKSSSPFNKKKWLKKHLNDILTLKHQGMTHLAVIDVLKTQHTMPFELTESLLSRYLKEFNQDEKTSLKTKIALDSKVERQNNRLDRQNNEIQNLKRRLDRVLERNEYLFYENEELKDRNKILENKFLEGDARLKDLSRYNGYNNVHWKVAQLEERNDEFFQTILYLERLSERLAKPHEEANEKIQALTDQNKILEEDSKNQLNEIDRLRDRLGRILNSSHHQAKYIEQLNGELQNKSVELGLVLENYHSADARKVSLESQILEITEQLESIAKENMRLNERNLHFKQQLGKAKGILDQHHEIVSKHEIRATQHRFQLYGVTVFCVVLVLVMFFY